MNKYNKKHTAYLEKNQINCNDFSDLYSELREHDLPLTLSGRLEEHFDCCTECQSFAQEMESLIEEARHCFAPVEMPADAKDRLYARLNLELGLNF